MLSLKNVFCFSSITVAILLSSLDCRSEEANSGYVFYKLQGFHPDSQAIVKPVMSCEINPTILRAKTKTGELLQLPAGLGPVFVPDPNSSSSPAQVEITIKRLLPRFPQHKELLETLLVACGNKKASLALASSIKTSNSKPSNNSGDSEMGIPEIRLLSGITLNDANITRVEGDTAVVLHSKGISKVPLSDFGDIATLSETIKTAIEKAKENAQRIARSEQNKNVSGIGEGITQANGAAGTLDCLPNFTIEPRGPSVHGIRIGMLYSEFLEKLTAIYNLPMKTAASPHKCDMRDLTGSYINTLTFFTTDEHKAEVVVVGAAGVPAKVIFITLSRPLLCKMFKINGISFKEFNQLFIDNYGVPELNGTKQGYEEVMSYSSSKEGWKIEFYGANEQIHWVKLMAIPLIKDSGFGK